MVHRTRKEGRGPSLTDDCPSIDQAVDVGSTGHTQGTHAPVSPVRVGTWMCFIFRMDRIFMHVPILYRYMVQMWPRQQSLQHRHYKAPHMETRWSVSR